MTSLIVKTGHYFLKNDFLYDLNQNFVGGIAYRSRIVENLVTMKSQCF